MDTAPPERTDVATTWWDGPPSTQRYGFIWSRPVGLLVGLLGVATITLLIALANHFRFDVLSPGLYYVPLIAAVAYGWGGRVGAGTAAAALLMVWFLISANFSLILDEVSDWTRLFAITVGYAALVLLADAARRLRRANNRLETIINSIADGILVVDRRGDLIQTNDAMRQMLGGEVPRTLAERNARWQTRAGNGLAVAPGTGPTTRALRGDTSNGTELLIRTESGRDLLVSISGAPLRGRGGQILGAVIVCRNIDELRRLQQAKDDFLSIASHELKTPLTALGGYAQLLRQRMAQIGLADERATRYLAMVEAQTRRMGELVNSLLDVSRLDAGQLQLHHEACDLAALVRETTVQLGNLSTRHTVTVTAPDRLLGEWDCDRIEQVIVNLLTNAIRYSPDGGPISVTVGTIDQLPAAAAAPDASPGPAAFVSVRDQGLGIAPDQFDAIFDRFHRTHADAEESTTDARRGMGLGLYISREIVTRHGGHIWATSPGRGQGTTFTFTLPLTHTHYTRVYPASN